MENEINWFTMKEPEVMCYNGEYKPLVEDEDVKSKCNIMNEIGKIRNSDECLYEMYTYLVDRIYSKTHSYCPNCGSRGMSMTCVGYISIRKGNSLKEWVENYKPYDGNHATCQNCGKHYKVDDLVDEYTANKIIEGKD